MTFLHKENDFDRYYIFASYAYKDDDRIWYHPIDGTRKDFPPPKDKEVKREKWYYARKELIRQKIALDLFFSSVWDTQSVIRFLTRNSIVT